MTFTKAFKKTASTDHERWDEAMRESNDAPYAKMSPDEKKLHRDKLIEKHTKSPKRSLVSKLLGRNK